jgi:superoxide dismutase, Cu-Zn family
MKGICKITCEKKHDHGVIHLKQDQQKLILSVDIWGLDSGNHGFHIHKSGNLADAPHSLCSHYNPEGHEHGDLNSPTSHKGDLGNLYFDEKGECRERIMARRVQLQEIFGRSLVIHQHQDDLGKGPFDDSKKTGHSGNMELWGIIAVDEECS